ncbi:cyanophycin synthetase [Oceanibium sediminis]|uniref:cyanophycin synthetase n=1 Tax=Oceanibium sediminis TaxID=2026339 RepID=UPI001300A945|nr:cyanophycin synthetase [Oceanibium sediminis]
MSDTLAPGHSYSPGLTRLLGGSRMYRARRVLDLRSVLLRRRLAPVRAAWYRDLWLRTAADIGASCEQTPLGLTRIRRGPLETYVSRSDIMLDSPQMLKIVGDKPLSYEIFAAKGLRVPAHCAFSLPGIAAAEAFLARASGPVVVKPAAGSGGGRGVTTGISTAAALRRAARYASGYGRRLLVEEELSGASYRLLYLDGAYIDAVRRDPPIVTGDGRRAIRQLIAAENVARIAGKPVTALSPLLIDRDMLNTLERTGLSLGDCPGAGQVVPIKGAVNENAAAQNHSVKDQVHPDIIERAGALVRDMGVRFAGVDLIMQDIALPLERGEGLISEVNANPGLHHHYLVSDPDAGVPVARRILEYLFDAKVGVVVR